MMEGERGKKMGAQGFFFVFKGVFMGQTMESQQSKEKVRTLVGGMGNDGEKATGPSTGSLEEVEGLLESKYRG